MADQLPDIVDHGRRRRHFCCFIAQARTEIRDGGRILVEQQPHCQGVHFVGVSPHSVVQVLGERAKPFDAKAARRRIHPVSRNRLSSRVAVEDAREFRNAVPWITHGRSIDVQL